MGNGVILRKALGNELREIRKTQNLTLRQVAEGAFSSYSYLSEVETGKKEVSSEFLFAICESLGVPMSDVLYAVTEKIALTEKTR